MKKNLEQIINREKACRVEGGDYGITACKESIKLDLELNKDATLFTLLEKFYKRAQEDVFFNRAMILACWELINEQEEAEVKAERTWKVDEYVFDMDGMVENVTRECARRLMSDEDFETFCKLQDEKLRKHEEWQKEFGRTHYFPGCYGDPLEDC